MSTGLLPLESSPRLDNSPRNSTTFSLAGSIVYAHEYYPVVSPDRETDSYTPVVRHEREDPHEKTHVHAPLTRAAYTIWRYNGQTARYVARIATIGQ